MTEVLRRYLARVVVFAGLVLATSVGYLALRAHYLPYGQGFRFPAANLIYPSISRSALAPIWDQSDFSECFYSKADGLGTMQLEVYSYLEHRRPNPVYWTLEDLDKPSSKAVRSGSFPAADMHDYGFVRLRFDPIPQSAGRLYRLTLKSPQTTFRESGAVILYRTGDTEAIAAQQACGAARPTFSVLSDKKHEHELTNIFFRYGATVSQVITPQQDFMTSLQVQMTAGGLRTDYKVHWSIVRLEDQKVIGTGDIATPGVEDWQMVDLFLPERERCNGRAYKLTLGAEEGGGNDMGAVGLPVFPFSGSTVATFSTRGSSIQNGFSANVSIVDSQAMRGLRLWAGGDLLAPDEYLASNMTLWYFPQRPSR
jgi:hypothetical protein